MLVHALVNTTSTMALTQTVLACAVSAVRKKSA